MENIYIHFKGEEDFVKKILSLINKVDEYQTMHLTEFLTPYHQTIVQSLVAREETLSLSFDGGIVNGEMKRALIYPSYFKIEQSDFKINVFKIKYATKFTTLKHSDVLGALMSKGLKRERFGDIVINQNEIYFACDKYISNMLENELTNIKKTSVALQKTDEIVYANIEYTSKTFFITSYRLDVVLAAFYKLSRSEVNRYIKTGFVKVNHKEVVENNFLCHNKDVISFKKHGRVMLVTSDRTTRQGNHVVEGYFYK